MPGKLVRGTSFIFIGQLVRMVAKGGLIFLLTRYLLQPAEYGLLFLTLSVLSVALLLANLGIPKAGAKYITEYRESAPELVSTVVQKTLIYNCIAIGAVSVGIYVMNDRVATFVGEPGISGLLLLGIGYVAIKSLSDTFRMFFQGFNRMGLVATVSITTNVLLVLFVPVLVVLGYGLEGALVGYVLSSAGGALIGSVVLFRRFYERHNVGKDLRKKVSRRILNYSLPLTFTMSANVINSRADTILLSIFRGPTAIAFYTLGKQISDFLITPANSLGFGVSPTYGERKANDELERASEIYEQSFIYTVAIYAPAAAGIVFVAEPTVRLLFGSDYVGAGQVLQIFSVFVFLRALDAITTDALDYLGRARARAVAKGATSVANVGLNIVLIPLYGVIGAAAATVITYSIYVGAELFVIADELPIGLRRLLRMSSTVGSITVGMSAVVYPLTGFISGILSLVGVIGVGGGIWVVLTVLTGVVDIRQLSSSLT